MQLSANGIRAGLLALGMILFTSIIIPSTALAADNEKDARDVEYVAKIIKILRAHVSLMRDIIEHRDLKYADNMVRHARALDRVIGMVGPMDWHSAKSFEIAQKADNNIKLTKAEFEELARASHQKVEAINRAADRYVRDKDGERMNNAIDELIGSCVACHSKFPKRIVPSVWMGMTEN